MENGEWRMENGKWRMENLEWRMENEEWRMENLEWRIENVYSTIIHIMRKENILRTKSFHFAIRIVKLYKFLKEKENEYVLIKQLLRCGTSVGALIRESENAESSRDFVHKLSIALKEADETQYWLELLLMTEFINKEMFDSINNDAEELVKLLVASIKTVKAKSVNIENEHLLKHEG